MPILLLLALLNLVFIAFYMRARINENLRQVAFFQPGAVILSWLIAASSLLSPQVNLPLTIVVLAGMAVAILGDFLNLDMTAPNVILRGLVIALISYLTYGIGLTVLNGFHLPDLATGAVLLIFYALFMRYLWPSLGSMRIPALIYGLVLPFTFWRALSTFFGTQFLPLQSILLSLGTLFLYVGDIEFALHTYKNPRPVMYGPILYSGGQLLIALSTVVGLI